MSRTDTPDLEGPAGRAWRLAADDSPTTLAAWLIYAPGQHIAWAHFMAGAIDLADVDGFPPAHKQFGDARWEIGVWALQDGLSGKPQPLPDGSNITPLHPQNVQVHLPDHPADLIKSVLEIAVQAACNGRLRLEPFGLVGPLWEEWRSRIEATIEHPPSPWGRAMTVPATVTFDPDCKHCGGTLRICECHLFTDDVVDGPFDDYHPPHGRPFWEWKGMCKSCHEHEWAETSGIPPLRRCTICNVYRDAHADDMPPCTGCYKCAEALDG